MIRSALIALAVSVILWLPLVQAQEKSKDKEDDEIKNLVKELKNKNSKVRMKAAQDLGEKGEEAVSAAKPLCDALMDPSPRVATASLQALEKVSPDLYGPLSTMMLDKSTQKHLNAIKELGFLGEKASPAINVLLASLRKQLAARSSKRNYGGLTALEIELFAAIRQINPDDTETLKYYKLLAGSGNSASHARLEAILFLTKWAGDDQKKRKEILPFIRSGLDNNVCQLTCIDLAGSYGALAKDFLPLLKELKLSSNEAVRSAASRAYDRIENP